MMLSTKPRHPPSKPIHHLLDSLRDLQVRLEQTGGGSRLELLEAYDYFCREGERGRSCPYSIKCERLFLREDFQEIREMIEEVARRFGEMDAG